MGINEINPEVTAILTIGYRQEMAELVQQALDYSAYECLYEPHDMSKVLSLVDEIIKRKERTG